jgi:CheY-like chemotaxis protein
VHVFADDQERAWAAGCDVFLLKPIEPLSLGDTLRGLLARKAATPS